MSETPMEEAEGAEPAEEPAGDTLVFEVDLDAPPEKVWRALNVRALREAWLGAPEAGEAAVAGVHAGERLDLVWPTREGESLVSFELAPAEGGSHLTITHRPPQTAMVLEFRLRTKFVAPCGGWRMAA